MADVEVPAADANAFATLLHASKFTILGAETATEEQAEAHRYCHDHASIHALVPLLKSIETEIQREAWGCSW